MALLNKIPSLNVAALDKKFSLEVQDPPLDKGVLLFTEHLHSSDDASAYGSRFSETALWQSAALE